MTRTTTKNKQIAVDSVFNPTDQGASEWVARAVWEENPLLNWGKNGNCRHGIYFGDKRYIWEARRDGRSNSVSHLRTTGFSDSHLHGASRPVRADIRQTIRQQSCCNCGSRTNIEVDHKNDLYNDPRVLNTETQRLEDFQPLCRKCNLSKREANVKTRSSGRRQGPPASILLALGVNFTEGDDTFVSTDVNWYKGTYWGDPTAFINTARTVHEERIREETRSNIDREWRSEIRNMWNELRNEFVSRSIVSRSRRVCSAHR